MLTRALVGMASASIARVCSNSMDVTALVKVSVRVTLASLASVATIFRVWLPFTTFSHASEPIVSVLVWPRVTV